MASAAVQNKTPRKVLKKSTRDSLIAYSFIAPNFIGFCVFTLVPMVFAIALAFCAWVTAEIDCGEMHEDKDIKG